MEGRGGVCPVEGRGGVCRIEGYAVWRGVEGYAVLRGMPYGGAWRGMLYGGDVGLFHSLIKLITFPPNISFLVGTLPHTYFVMIENWAKESEVVCQWQGSF